MEEAPAAQPDPTMLGDQARIRAQLNTWRENLIDLSRGNPLLGINRSRTSKLRVTQPSASDLFDTLVIKEEKLRLPLVRRRIAPVAGEGQGTLVLDELPPSRWEFRPGDLTFEGSPEDLFRRLRRIRDNARTTVEERGVTTLHLTFATLDWNDPRLGESIAPLYLVPCAIESTGPEEPLRLVATDEDPQLNPALAIYLREQFEKDLPPLPEEPERGVIGDLLRQLRAGFGADWRVSHDVWLSTFSFETLTMYKDLETLTEAALEHPVVRAFAGVRVSADASERLGEDLDALPTPGAAPVPVLPSDSSQLEALAYARTGRHVLVHGPPGTGKSQTIANLIVNALGDGKTVLFVSAKKAALDVVFDRLKRLGFDRFCLEAHSVKAGRRRVIEELKRTLEAAGQHTGVDPRETLTRYRQLRDRLNEAVRELHRPREPIGHSTIRGSAPSRGWSLCR